MGIKLQNTGQTYSILVSKVFGRAFNIFGLAFRNYANSIMYEQQFNPQALYISRFLNDQFDPTHRRIYIENLLVFDKKPIYKRVEAPASQVYIYKRSETPTSQYYIFKRNELAGRAYDFIIKIPADLTALKTNEKFLASVEKYMLPDKMFIIDDSTVFYDVTFNITELGTGNPILGASIKIIRQGKIIAVRSTDINGDAAFSLPNDTYDYAINTVGYTYVTAQFLVTGSSLNFNIQLS